MERTTMKLTFTTLTLTAAVVAATAMPMAFAQDQTQPRAGRAAGARKGMQKFQADLDKAVSRANLSAQQRRDLDNIRANMQKQAETRRQGGTVDRQAMRQNMQALRDLISSEAFQAEDREILTNDLKQMRKAGKHRGGGRRNSAPSTTIPPQSQGLL
jgi:hypothetical protein